MCKLRFDFAGCCGRDLLFKHMSNSTFTITITSSDLIMLSGPQS